MKTKTAIFLGAVAALSLAFAPCAARADLIYWMVDDPTESWTTGSEEPVTFAYATIKADDTLLFAYDTSGNTSSPVMNALAGSGGSETGAAYFGSFDSSVQSFLVELWNASGDRVGWQTYSAASVADSIWKGNTTMGAGAKALTVSQVVPEPTSGLLLILGGALLALKRRRAAC